MKRLLLIITLVLFSAGFITEAFAAPARGGGLLKEQLPSDPPQLTKQHSTPQHAKKRLTKSARVKPRLNPRSNLKTARLQPLKKDNAAKKSS